MATSPLNADGSFTYLSAPGYEGTDTFVYTVVDTKGLTDTATVTVTVSDSIWYVNNALGVNGDGRSTSPFNSLTPVNGAGGAGDADDATDYIFLYSGSGNYTTGVELESDQRLWGQGSALVITATTLVAAGGTPTLTKTSGAAVTLASSNMSSNRLEGFDIVAGTATTGVSGSGFGTLTVGNVAIAASGPALDLATGALSGTLDSITSTNSAGKGVNLASVTGSLTVSGGSTVTGAVGNGIQVASSGAALNFGNTSVTSAPVILTGNTGAITFADLDIAPGASEKGLSATGNTGTITTTSGTISGVSNATALEIAGPSAASRTPLAVVLDAVSANGGTTGILLQNTNGTLAINGTGTTNGSGGTIQNMTGDGVRMDTTQGITLKNMALTSNASVDGAASCDGSTNTGCSAGIDMASATTVTLTNLQATNGQYGINGTTVSALTISNSTITNAGNEAAEHGIRLTGLTGTSSLTNTTVTGSAERNMLVENSSGTLTLGITSSTCLQHRRRHRRRRLRGQHLRHRQRDAQHHGLDLHRQPDERHPGPGEWFLDAAS